MFQWSDPNYLRTVQYRNGASLSARIELYRRFSTNPYGWFRWVFDQFELTPSRRLLELGCGSGDLWAENQLRIPERLELILTDLSEGMANQARQNLALPNYPWRFATLDAQAIPFPEACFDAVVALHVLFHIPNRAKALSEIRRVLKPRGRFYTSTLGERHLRELPLLLEKFNPGIAPQGEKRPFTLENGPAQLAPWFTEVAMAKYEDSLHVREAGPLVDYILSSPFHGVQEEQREELLEFIDKELKAQGGAMGITTEAGLIIAH